MNSEDAALWADWERRAARYAKILEGIRAKAARGEDITLVILAYQNACVDNFSRLYPLLAAVPQFKVTLVLSLYLYDGNMQVMFKKMQEAEKVLRSKGLPYRRSFDPETRQVLNVNEELRPDIVLVESGYNWNHPNFLPDAFPDSLYFYIPYGGHLADNLSIHFHQKVMNQAYKLFTTMRPERAMFKAHSRIQGANVAEEFPGPLKLDPIFDLTYVPRNVWKETGKPLKKIIWAPHHAWAGYGNFIHYKDFMLKLAFTQRNRLQIAFKPHPALRESLRAIHHWSAEEVDAYYAKWAHLNNGQLEEGEWIDLFLGSDAMILDSVSFMAEYSATGKPACYVVGHNSGTFPSFNEIGNDVLRILYHADNEEDILGFVQGVVLEGRDVLKARRTDFVRQVLIPDNAALACKNYCAYFKNLCFSNS